MQTEFPPTNIMDQVSDWLGGFVPGCAHLPPRHPLKVSLVMGLLGLISGWLYYIAYWLFDFQMGHLLVRLTGLLGLLSTSWLLVLAPLCLWNGCRFIIIVLSIFPSILSFLYMIIWNTDFRLKWNRPNEPYWDSFFFFAVLVAIPVVFHAGWIAAVIRRRILAVLILPMCLCSLLGASVFQLINFLKWPAIWLGGVPAIAAISTTCLITLGCCLGVALWDSTPLPRFAAHVTSTAAKSS